MRAIMSTSFVLGSSMILLIRERSLRLGGCIQTKSHQKIKSDFMNIGLCCDDTFSEMVLSF